MRLIETGFYLLFIIVPLILTPWNYELFEFNKMLTVYALSAVIAAGWLTEMVRQKKWLFSRTPLDLPLALFLVSQIIATVFSVEPHTSFWGYYSRFHGGLLSTICYLTLYWAYATFMREKTGKNIRVILSTGLIVSLYGIAERLGIDKHIWQQKVQERVFSTLGQPNWLAAYLVLLIPLAWSRPKWQGKTLTGIMLLTLLFTHSRSGFIGLAAAAFTYIVFSYRRLVLPAVLLALVGLGFSYRFLSRENLPAPAVPAVSQGGSSTTEIRRVVWQGAVDIWRHYPVFGPGAETYAYTYYNFRPAAHNLLSEWDYLYNKAHNEWLNYLATSGAFGLGSYLLVLGWTAGWLIKQRRADLLAGYCGAAVVNFFGFSVVPVALLGFLYPAFALKQTVKAKPAYQKVSNLGAVLITGILLAAFYWLLFVVKLWQADYLFNLGRNQVKAGWLANGWQNLDQTVRLRPAEPVFRNDLAEAEAQLAVAYASPSAELSREFMKKSVASADEVIRQNPLNLNFWRSRIKIFLTLAVLDPAFYNQSLEAFNQAIALAPTDPKLTFNLALVYSQLGQSGLAEQMLVKTVELKPNYEAARQNLGSLYEQTGRPDLARQQYKYILEHLNPANAAAKAGLEQL